MPLYGRRREASDPAPQDEDFPLKRQLRHGRSSRVPTSSTRAQSYDGGQSTAPSAWSTPFRLPITRRAGSSMPWWQILNRATALPPRWPVSERCGTAARTG